MINAWTQVKSYHGHFERSQTTLETEKNKIYDDKVCIISNLFIKYPPFESLLCS